MALDATPGGSASNSFVTEAEASSYLSEQRLYITAWTAATVGDREKALIWGTMLLDAYFDWEGFKVTTTQALRWPRSGVLDVDGWNVDQTTIPLLLKRATATMALRLLEGDRMKEPAILGLGFSEAAVGPLSVTIDSRQMKGVIPDDVIALLVPLGSPKGETGKGDRMVRVRRG